MSSFITTSATQSVFELVLARPVATVGGEDASRVHLWWRAPQQGDRVVQIYVDDVLVDVSLHPARRELWLSMDRSVSRRIELLAVDANDADAIWRAQSQLLLCWSPRVASDAQATVIRDETLAVDMQVSVVESGSVIDEGKLWPGEEHRSGFGALLGQGGFGFDEAAGPGLGLGELGMGPIGSDATAWRWRRNDLNEGDHVFELHGDSQGGESLTTPVILATKTIERLAGPANNLQMQSNFTLTWDQP